MICRRQEQIISKKPAPPHFGVFKKWGVALFMNKQDEMVSSLVSRDMSDVFVITDGSLVAFRVWVLAKDTFEDSKNVR